MKEARGMQSLGLFFIGNISLSRGDAEIAEMS
jgi:hypothetical protein